MNCEESVRTLRERLPEWLSLSQKLPALQIELERHEGNLAAAYPDNPNAAELKARAEHFLSGHANLDGHRPAAVIARFSELDKELRNAGKIVRRFARQQRIDAEPLVRLLEFQVFAAYEDALLVLHHVEDTMNQAPPRRGKPKTTRQRVKEAKAKLEKIIGQEPGNKTKKANTLINQADVREQDGRKALRELQREGKYDGFKRPAPQKTGRK